MSNLVNLNSPQRSFRECVETRCTNILKVAMSNDERSLLWGVVELPKNQCFFLYILSRFFSSVLIYYEFPTNFIWKLFITTHWRRVGVFEIWNFDEGFITILIHLWYLTLCLWTWNAYKTTYNYIPTQS